MPHDDSITSNTLITAPPTAAQHRHRQGTGPGCGGTPRGQARGDLGHSGLDLITALGRAADLEVEYAGRAICARRGLSFRGSSRKYSSRAQRAKGASSQSIWLNASAARSTVRTTAPDDPNTLELRDKLDELDQLDDDPP